MFAPQRHFGQSVVEGTEHATAHPLVAGEELGGDGNRLWVGTVRPLVEGRFEVVRRNTENLQRSHVFVGGEQHGDIPPGHHAVDEPTACERDHLGDVASHHVEPVSGVGGHLGHGVLFAVGAKSRASASPYSLNTSARGIEGSSSHAVSIPLTKASISTALTAASTSVR